MPGGCATSETPKIAAILGARSTNPDANDLVMRGLALLNEQSFQPSKEKNDASRALYKQAQAIDPNNAAAIAGLASNYFYECLSGYGNPGTDYDAKILGQADRAIALVGLRPTVRCQSRLLVALGPL